MNDNTINDNTLKNDAMKNDARKEDARKEDARKNDAMKDDAMKDNTKTNSNLNAAETNTWDEKKILLGILPYWDPIIPPNGIAHLKRFLQKHGYIVKTVDLIVEEKFQEIYSSYFKLLEEFVDESGRGNFFNIGHDVMQDHMMAHYNYTDEKMYLQLVKEVIHKTYYVRIDDQQARRLNRLLDEFYTHLEECFLQLVEKEKPSYIGLTAYKCTLPASLFALKVTREKYPHIRTLIGGGTFVDTHTINTPNFEILLEYSKDFLDKIIIGQGEILFLKYLQGKLPQSQRVYTKKDIQGEILQFPDAEIPDLSDFELQKYLYLTGTGSASCPYDCSFCCAKLFYGDYREKDPRQTAAEMIQLHKKHGHQLFFMTDSMVNPIIDGVAKSMIEADASIYYDTYYRVDDASTRIENTMLWRRGGLYRVRLGTESGSTRILEKMGKNITTDQIRAAVSSLALAGIKTTTYWVVGHPGETEEDFQATLDLIAELKDDIYQSEPNPFLYYYSTQTNSLKWAGRRKLLFPEEMQDMLVFKTWTLDIEPVREEVYRRLFRFTQHCKKLGIPNPYTLGEYIEADERWKKLHKNAAPSTMDFLSRKPIYENKDIKNSTLAKKIRRNRAVFDF